MHAALTSERRAREAEEETSKRDRQLGVVQRLSTALVGENEPIAIAGLLVREVSGLFGVSVAAFAEVSEDGATATYLGAGDGERELDWLVGTQIDLRSEPSGIATAAVDGSAFAVYDAETSPRLNRRLVERTSTRSAAFVPQVIDGRVAGVLVAGSHEPRVFTFDELELMRALVAEAGLALDRVRSAAALAAALERERLSSRITSHLRAELDVEAVLDVAVTEVGRALGLSRCFVRLHGPVTAACPANT